jgi:hypothetical protein
MPEVKPFITDVEQMRVAQRHYFKQIALAKKTRIPADFAAAATALKVSKALEAKVDAALPEMTNLEFVAP